MNEQTKPRYGPGPVDRCNGEGYADPTAKEALIRIKKEDKVFRPLIYICSPFSGDTVANTEKARCYSRMAVEKGYIPFAPHLLLPQYMDDSNPDERALAMFMNTVFLSKCNELWVFGTRVSEGMQREIIHAERHRKVIRYFTEDMEERT